MVRGSLLARTISWVRFRKLARIRKKIMALSIEMMRFIDRSSVRAGQPLHWVIETRRPGTRASMNSRTASTRGPPTRPAVAALRDALFHNTICCTKSLTPYSHSPLKVLSTIPSATTPTNWPLVAKPGFHLHLTGNSSN